MAIVEKTNRKGVDKAIHVLQQRTYANLLGFWADGVEYTMYPRVNKNFKNDSTIPEISLDSKNYKETFYDDKVAVNSFFLVDDQSTYQNDNNQIVQDVSIIFQADLVKLYGDAERVDEVFNSDVLQVFKDVKRFIYSDIERITGFDSVYSDLSLSADLREKIQFSDISNRHILRLDFSIRYDFKCDSPIVPLCVPVTIMENGVLVARQAAGTTYSYSTAADPATITINDESFIDAPSDETTDINVLDQDDNPVGTLEPLTNTVRVEVVQDVIIYQEARYMGEEVSYSDGDAVWRRDNNKLLALTQPEKGIMQRLQNGNEYLLVYDNVFGNKFMFTGLTGGYYDPSDLTYRDVTGAVVTRADAFPNEIAVDHLYNKLVQTLQDNTQKSWSSWCLDGLTHTQGGFTEWYLPMITEVANCMDWSFAIPARDTVPFDWGNNMKLLGNTYTAGTTQALTIESYGQFRSRLKTNNTKAIYIKPIDINTEFG
jgi:hypothetical protein